MNGEHEFESELSERASDEPSLMVDVEGFEGPLDLLLTLARQQKVDLAKISILALADQYLAFIEQARKMRLELAADYLVMAAWLAYLKSNWSAGRNSVATCSSAASPSRSQKSSIRNGRRRSTTCFRPMPHAGKFSRALSCACPSARSGRLPRRAKYLNG